MILLWDREKKKGMKCYKLPVWALSVIYIKDYVFSSSSLLPGETWVKQSPLNFPERKSLNMQLMLISAVYGVTWTAFCI